MRLLPLIFLILFCPLCVFSQSVAEKQRQFDFWLGEWDVNLRVRQKDLSWKDQHRAVARIYPILDGKAVLELWSENRQGINGYSLRYYNPSKDRWDLWLNWAGKNRSGTIGMECLFRHKRAECFSERKIDEKTVQLSRYTFSDITADTLRWDDAFSRDGGRTWTNNWIMEFTRKAKKAPPLGEEQNPLTYFDGSRCDLPEFEIVKSLAANHKNDSRLRFYNILDGCITIGFIKTPRTGAFFSLTYNTYAKIYEFAYLDDHEATALAVFYGVRTADGFRLQTRGGKQKAFIKTGDAIESIELDYAGEKQTIGAGTSGLQ